MSICLVDLPKLGKVKCACLRYPKVCTGTVHSVSLPSLCQSAPKASNRNNNTDNSQRMHLMNLSRDSDGVRARRRQL